MDAVDYERTEELFDAGVKLRPGRFGIGIAITAASLYVCLLWVRMPEPWSHGTLGAGLRIQSAALRLFGEVIHALGVEKPGLKLCHGCYLVLTGIVVPWLVMACLRRGRPTDFGFRRPNRVGWRLLGVSYAASFLFVLWMVRSPEFAPYYQTHVGADGLLVFLTYNVVAMFAEHFFFHGVMLGAFRRGGRWPAPPPDVARSTDRSIHLLRWLGLAQPAGEAAGCRRMTRWLGLPDRCVVAAVASAALFGALHVGKDPREFLLSFPGGLGLAYLAYRANSWLTPWALHLATAGTAALFMFV